MKKEYIKPQFSVVRIATHHMLMTSGPQSRSVQNLEGFEGYGGTDTDGEAD